MERATKMVKVQLGGYLIVLQGERKSLIRFKIGVPPSNSKTGKKTDSVQSNVREKVKRTPLGIEIGMEIYYI